MLSYLSAFHLSVTALQAALQLQAGGMFNAEEAMVMYSGCALPACLG
jgi:hypothetical protein